MLLMLTTGWAYGQTVDGLYTAAVAIEDQSPSQVLAAKKSALAQVLVKVTGQASSLKHAQIRLALAQPDTYLKHFSFATQVVDQQAQALLELTFDQAQVDQLVNQAGLLVWGSERAAVLVWLVEEKQGERLIINELGHPVMAQIAAQAKTRGMPLIWPLLDLEDQLAIDAGALWGLFREPIFQASLRYQADAVLVGRIYQNQLQQWHVRWNFWLDEVEHEWSAKGADLTALVSPLQDRLAKGLVAKFILPGALKGATAVTESQSLRQVLLVVEQVDSLDDYAQLQQALASMVGISHVRLYSADASKLTFRLLINSQLAQVKSALDLKRRLTLVAEAELIQMPSEVPIWHYKWQR